MRFLELQIKGFGKFHDRSITFEDGINVVYGKNEAGKSTIHTFIRCMLFGMQTPRGRTPRLDLYNKYEPWEDADTYAGVLRLEHEGHNYRIERTFSREASELRIFDETLDEEVAEVKPLMDEFLCGLTETTYDNTISIGQLKSATEGGMVVELKRYISNMNTSGNMSLNITKASEFLNTQKRNLESQLVPEAAKSYTALLSQIKTLEKDISSPQYENHLAAFHKLKLDTGSQLEKKQAEQEEMIQKLTRGRQLLRDNNFKDVESIEQYETQTVKILMDYRQIKAASEKNFRKAWVSLSFALAVILAVCAVVIQVAGTGIPYIQDFGESMILAVSGCGGLAVLFGIIGLLLLQKIKQSNRELALATQAIQETFKRHLGDMDLSDQALEAFRARMDEFKRLSVTTDESEVSISKLGNEISALIEKQNSCNHDIEKQQRAQWELEKKLELLSGYKNQLESLKNTLAENQRISQELSSIELALETMTELSETIKDSFGLYLNKTASDLIGGITGGIYSSMYIDENLDIFMNTKSKMVPMEQVSSGTMDQIYLALRLAAAKLIQGEQENMPLIFDDSFVLYDDERLKSALKWLSTAYNGQLIIFTCHKREKQMLTDNQIVYHPVEI